MIRIHNTQTNEIIDREMTDDEYTIHQAEKAADAARIVAEEEAKQQAFNDAVAAAVAVALAAPQEANN